METAQAVTEKAEESKATEEKSVSSVAESVPKNETVNELTFDRIAAVPQDAHRGQMMDEVEATTKTAHETMKEADIPTETGEYENASEVGVEKASTTMAASTHESKQDATDDVGWSNTVSASVPLERGQQAETQKTGTVAVRRQKQLGVSSSEEHKTFHKASRWGYSRAATGRGAGRARCRLARARVANDNRLHQTCRPVNEYTHVCVEKCPLTARHTARRSGDSCGMSDDRTREL